MAMSNRKYLITGATGKQGGAVIESLIRSSPATPIEVLAVTRNPSSAGAQALVSKFSVKVIKGDLNNCNEIFKTAGADVWGVFSVQLPSMRKDGGELEIKQGCSLIDAALAHGVKQFVYTSVDRGGSKNSDNDPTNVPHFASKYRVERYLREATTKDGSRMNWTILRPVAFMDNLNPGFFGKAFASFWAGMGDKRLQLVSTHDIGEFGASALREPEKFRNKAITIVGDDLTQREGDIIFQKVYGKPMPTTYSFVASAIQWGIKELGIMFQWFKEVGYGGDTNECRRLHPGMLTLEKWLKEFSKFEK